MNHRRFLLDTLERTARTFVQGFLAVVTVDAFSDLAASWQQKLAAGALAGLYAVLTSFAAQPAGAPDSASFLPADVDPPLDE